MNSIEIIAENYDQLFCGNFDTGNKQYVGANPPQRCRFCQRNASELTFSTVAHAIPELLGNRRLVSKDECDDCNRHFANHAENDLGIFTKPYRLMGQVRGKRSVPSYKTLKGLSRVDFKAGAGFEISEREDDVLHEIDEENNRVHFHFLRETYCPAAAYKALAKIAISVMPESELESFEHVRKWILCSDHTKHLMQPLNLLLYFVPGPKPHIGTSVLLLRRKADSKLNEIPYCMLVLAFGNFQFQVVIPALQDNRGNGNPVDITIPRFPSAFGADWPYGEPKAATIDMTPGVKIPPETCTITMHYESIEKNDG